MTTCKDIIRRALRYLGVLQGGKVPDGPVSADGMEALQDLFLALPGLTQNGRWNEVSVSTGSYTANPGDRVTVIAPGVVVLPALIDPLASNWYWGDYEDEFGWDGLDPRPPLDLTRVAILGGENTGIWIYSATKGAWSNLLDVGLEDDFPFGDEDVLGIAAQLAVDLNPEYGSTLDPRTIALANQSARALKARFAKAAPYDWSRPGIVMPVYRDYV